MRISIAMATYNGEEYLEEQLISFLSQTRHPDELVVCDDCSSDKTTEILKSFSARSPFEVRIYKNDQNLGFLKNFEKALSLVDGDWVALSDQDDVWLPNKLEVLESTALKDKKALVITHDKFVANGQLEVQSETHMELLSAANSKNVRMIAGCATFLRANFLSTVLPIPSSAKAHDVWIHSLAHRISGARRHVDVPLLIYRRHQSNSSRAYEFSGQHVSRLGRLLYYRSPERKIEYASRLENLYIMRERLCRFLGHDAGSLDREISAFDARGRIINFRFPNRQIMAVKALVNGDYFLFEGWYSFFRDFFTFKG